MTIEKGQKAPDFTLYSTEKQPVTLSSLHGKNVVLLFFPLAFTSVCTKELCAIRDSYNVYDSLNATVFGISVDSPQTLKVFKEQQNLNFELLSDFNKEASTAYGSIYETFAMDMKGVSKRSAFVIDKEGTIQYAEVLENAGEMPDLDAVKECLNGLQ